MSLRIASEIEDVTKLAREYGIMIAAKKIATYQYDRPVFLASRSLTFRLSAVTGLSRAANFVSEASRFAAVASFQPLLNAARAPRMPFRTSDSTSMPIFAAYLRRR